MKERLLNMAPLFVRSDVSRLFSNFVPKPVFNDLFRVSVLL